MVEDGGTNMASNLKYSVCKKCGKKSRRTVRPIKVKGYFTTNAIGYVCLTCGYFEPDDKANEKTKQYSVEMLNYLTDLEKSGIDINNIVKNN